MCSCKPFLFKFAILFAAFLVLDAVALQAQEVLAVRNAEIYPVTGPVIPSGVMIVTDGKITAIGADVSIPDNAKTIDAKGRIVMPGIVENHSHMGMKRLWVPGRSRQQRDLRSHQLSAPRHRFHRHDG